MADLSAGDTKLVQYLNEAYGLEKRLETALQAHIVAAVRPPYKKRLKEHLSETKRHAREVKQRIKQLGGVAETISVPGPEPIAEAAQAVVAGAQKAVALAQGPLHALRGTGEDEKQLKNAKTEYASEAEEIATYTAIEALAEALGDRDTKRLVRVIRREEERMLSFLEKEIPRLTKAVVNAEIPASGRRSARATASSGGSRKASAAPKARATAKAKAAAKARPGSSAAKPAAAKRRPAGKAKPKAAAGTGRAVAKAAAKARPARSAA
jgi:ferritin-like metal-binding protein YciE